MANRAAEGLAALNSHDYPKAISCYSAALLVSPTSPDYYLKRSMAHQRSTPPDYHGALSDATMAVVAAARRAKRELIAAAQLRRAIALYCLERYADADFLFDVVKELDPKEKSVAIHKSQTKAKLAALPEGDERAKVAVVKLPDIELSPALPGNKDTKADDASIARSTAGPNTAKEAPGSTLPQKIKHEWYQSSGKVHLTLLAKGVPRDSVTVDIQPSAVSGQRYLQYLLTLQVNVTFPTTGDSSYDLSLDPLFATVDPAKSTYSVTTSKIEIVLEKCVQRKWSSLEATEPAATDANAEPSIPHQAPTGPTKESAPSYPTSSKSGPKNWDKLASDMEVDKEGDEMNNFFQTLYSGADPDTRRAMMKSYQESNGTVLSTNWAEVGKGKVETSPPDGMVEQKWNS